MTSYEETFRNKNVLITGGLGFIGSNLAHRLVPLGTNVTIVDSLIPAYGGNMFNLHGIEGNVKVNIADVRDQHSMDSLVKGQHFMFNLAGTLSHLDSMRDPFTDLEINSRSQLSILEACRKYNRDIKIVFTGTRGQYGKPRYLPVDENHPLHPTDINGINNLAGEMYHLLYYEVYGIRAASLRLTNTYGPRHQMKHPRQGIVNWFVRQTLDGEQVKIFGDGKQIRDTNYVDDVVDALLTTMSDERSNGQAYNLGGIPLSLEDIVKKIIEIHGRGEFTHVVYPTELQKIEIGDYIADYTRIKRELDWSPRVTLHDGLGRTIEFYKKHRDHYWKPGEIL